MGWTPSPSPAPGGGLATDPQLKELEGLLDKGAPAHGFPNESWAAARVALLIRSHFGVEYHPDHVLRLLRRRLGWACHKPRRRARQRNDKEEGERWKADEFPRILREAFRRKAHVAFLDESGFMLMPLVRRTLARRGRRVFIRCSARHDRISAISCVTISPRAMRVGLYFFGFLINENFHGEEGVGFLGYLTRQVPGEWTVVGDRNNIHSRSKAVKAWLAEHGEVVVEDFPAHDPDANPDGRVGVELGQVRQDVRPVPGGRQ